MLNKKTEVHGAGGIHFGQYLKSCSLPCGIPGEGEAPKRDIYRLPA